MTLRADQIQSVVQELQPLLGGRIQRIDLIGAEILVLELRCPGQTHRLLFSAEKNLGRLHLIDRRPPKPESPKNFQGVLRKFLSGESIIGMFAEGFQVTVRTRQTELTINLLESDSPFSIKAIKAGQGEEALLKPFDSSCAFPLSAALVIQYEQQSKTQRESDLRQTHLKTTNRKIKKLRRLKKNLESDRDRFFAMRASRHHAELLKVNLSSIPRGASVFETTDWEGRAVSIPLDPKLGPKSNMARLFLRAKKADRGWPRVETRLNATVDEIKCLEMRKAEIESMTFEMLQTQTIPIQSQATVSTHKGKQKQARESGIRRFTTIDGFDVRVGKGARENETLTLRVARGHDIWLHARGRKGAHVLLRLEKNADPSAEALLDACHLAAFYSEGRNEKVIEILYTRAKYVKKSKGSALGAVSVAKEKTIHLRLQASRLNRLLGREDLDS